MKKNLSRCTDCGDDSSIPTQVSSGPEVVLPAVTAINLNTQKKYKTKLPMLKKKKNKKIKSKKKEFLNFFVLGFVFKKN